MKLKTSAIKICSFGQPIDCIKMIENNGKEGWEKMNSWLYGAYAVILGIVSFFTGEVVTFVMLGIILVSLNNINSTLKKMNGANKDHNKYD
jgi:hypothetical protein